MKRDPSALEGREHDVLVIGGGIAGAWVAWEAASRGLKAALVEAEDFGQATSWSSLKTAHGGLRHLQRLDIAGFRESVRERRGLLRVAPEIVRPLTFAIPLSGLVDRVKFFLGGLANDVLSLDRNDHLSADQAIGISRVVGPDEAGILGVRDLSGGGAFIWQDAQITHTERLLVGLLHAASEAEAAAVVVNHCRIESGVRTPAGFEIRAADTFSGRTLKLRARSVVNASGANLEVVARLLGETCGSPTLLRGANVVLGRNLTPSLALGVPVDGRYLFLVPWLGRSILGTVYDDGQKPLPDLVSALIDASGRAFPWAEISHEDIRVVHAGHVPGAPTGEPMYRSRLIVHANPRTVSVLTAKYTTARATAEAAIDHLGRVLALDLSPSASVHTALARAVPLAGPVEEQIRLAKDEEMALSAADAVRGRLRQGAFGQTV